MAVQVTYLLIPSQHCSYRQMSASRIGFRKLWLESPRLESRACVLADNRLALD